MKEKSWITFLAIGPMLLIPVMVALISFVFITAEKSKLDSSLSRMEQDTISYLKSTIHSKVNNIVDLAAYRNSVVKAELHLRIQQRVDDACKIASQLYTLYSPIKSEQEVKRLIVEALRPLVWNQGESFIWILDFDGVAKLEPDYLRHLEGKSVIDLKDATGREVIKEEIELVQTKGHGFIWDTSTKANAGVDEQFDQLVYVKGMGIYNWYMGSAEFLDTATKYSDGRLLAEVSKFSKEGSDYFFIVNKEGVLLLNHARPDLVGKKISVEKFPNYDEILVKIKKASLNPEGGFIEYRWLNPLVNREEDKITYVRAVPGVDWVVGSGFHPADIHREMVPKIAESSALNQAELERLQEIGLWSFILSIFVSVALSFAVYRLLWSYREKVENKNRELTDLNNQFEVKVSNRTKALEVVNDELEILARTDSLTGINNRFAFMDIIATEVKHAAQSGEDLALIIFDIDLFKVVNDQHGHDVGDSVLIEQARVVNDCLREDDSFSRLGGEEFGIILPNTELAVAKQVAECIRVAFENYPFTTAGQVTISLGVGLYQAGTESNQLIKRVDVALYDAKRTGRNRVCIAK
ncbi:MAG: hypothetical protein ISEC1_P0749 [Thiomicrorhabdus sp.]|nr:MAG: hypothetical protein ISEC1_P0749 [Thiomicrorhabdus sp.]